MIRVTYYTQNPFNHCHPSFVTIDERTGRIFQSENTGKEYRFNMVDFLNERYKNASTNYGDEICSIAEPSLCGGFKTGLKVSFDDWLTELDQGNTWSEFPEQRAEFEKAYEALQAEEKKKQRKAPPAAQKTRLAYTSPWQAVINWARGAAGGSTSSPGTSAPPPTAGYTPPTPSPPTLPPPGQLPPSTKPSLPPFGGSGPSKLRPKGEDEGEDEGTKPTSPLPGGTGGGTGGGKPAGTPAGNIPGLGASVGGPRLAENFEAPVSHNLTYGRDFGRRQRFGNFRGFGRKVKKRFKGRPKKLNMSNITNRSEDFKADLANEDEMRGLQIGGLYGFGAGLLVGGVGVLKLIKK